MTREEIEQLNVSVPYCCETDREEQWYQVGLIDGLSIADEHPRKGLWDSEKVCERLHEIINSDTIVQYLIFDDENIDFDSGLFFEDLRKSMED